MRVHGHEVTEAPLKTTKKGKERASSNHGAEFKAEPTVKAPALVPSRSRDRKIQEPNQKRKDGESIADIESRLDKRAAELGAAPANPKPGRRFEIRDALARGHTAGELEELVAVAVENRWAKKQKFWGDVVAHAVKCSRRYRQALGRAETWGRWGSEVEREASVGARPDADAEDEDQEEAVEADHDRTKPVEEPVEEAVEDREPVISWAEFLRKHPELENWRNKSAASWVTFHDEGAGEGAQVAHPGADKPRKFSKEIDRFDGLREGPKIAKE